MAMAVSPIRVTTKALRGGPAVRWVLIPEPDEQIAAQTHALPAQVEQQQVVGQDQDQHRPDKEIHIGEEAAISVVFVGHEFGGVEMDQEADKGHHQHHDHRKGIQMEARLRYEIAYADPCPERLRYRRRRAAGTQEVDRDQQRENADMPTEPTPIAATALRAGTAAQGAPAPEIPQGARATPATRRPSMSTSHFSAASASRVLNRGEKSARPGPDPPRPLPPPWSG